MASACAAPELARTFEQMAREEKQHVDWWSDLLLAWDNGLVPDIADAHGMLEKLLTVKHEISSALPERFEDMAVDEMLDLAAHLEFFMLDAAFGELADLMQPGGHADHRESYSRHVMRLVEAIGEHHSSESLASFLAKVLLRAYADQQRLAALSVQDPLTGLYNRRGILSHLAQWLAWSARYDRPVAVLLVDVDRFKEVNDGFGHPAGDAVLTAIAEALRGSVRNSDLVGRFGGDEFLVLAPETSAVDLDRVTERLLADVRAVKVEGVDLPVTVSVGAAWSPGGLRMGSEAVIAAADGSLYEAKSAGRDRAGIPRTPAAFDA